MSYKHDALADQIEERQRAYVAQALGISSKTLANHPYELEANGTKDGIVTSWDLYWQDTPPEGVNTEGSARTLWTSIPPDNSDRSGPDEV